MTGEELKYILWIKLELSFHQWSECWWLSAIRLLYLPPAGTRLSALKVRIQALLWFRCKLGFHSPAPRNQAVLWQWLPHQGFTTCSWGILPPLSLLRSGRCPRPGSSLSRLRLTLPTHWCTLWLSPQWYWKWRWRKFPRCRRRVALRSRKPHWSKCLAFPRKEEHRGRRRRPIIRKCKEWSWWWEGWRDKCTVRTVPHTRQLEGVRGGTCWAAFVRRQRRTRWRAEKRWWEYSQQFEDPKFSQFVPHRRLRNCLQRRSYLKPQQSWLQPGRGLLRGPGSSRLWI